MGVGKVYLSHPTINVGVREVDFGEIGSWFQAHDVLGLFFFFVRIEVISDYPKHGVAIVSVPGMDKNTFLLCFIILPISRLKDC